MEVKVYGKPDSDPTLMDAVVAFAKEMGAAKLLVAAHQRVPVDARPCQHPNTLFYELQLDDDKCYSARLHLATRKISWTGR